MSSLAGKTLLSTYTSLLKLEGDTQTLVAGGGTAIRIKTGDNEVTPIYLNTDRVGIGTGAPAANLHVADGNTAVMIGDGAANEQGYLIFNVSNTAVNYRIASNTHVPGGLEITPSTGGGGTTFNTPTLVVKGANVGIGTASPDYKLEIEGSTKDAARTLSIKCTNSTGGSDGGGTLQLSHDEGSAQDSGEQMGRIDFAAAEDGSNNLDLGASIYTIASGHWDADTHGADLIFATTPETASGDENPQMRMTIKDSGKVGIGTAVPAATLTVSSSSTDPAVGGILIEEGTTDILAIHSGGSGIAVYDALFTSGTADHVFRCGNTERMRIKEDGNVGIGTAAPTLGQLQVSANGTNAQGTLTVSSFNDQAERYSVLTFQKSNSDTANALSSTASGDYLGQIRWLGVDNSGSATDYGASIMAKQTAATNTTLETDLIFSTYNTSTENANQLVLDGSTGNVGIGIAASTAKLHVDQASASGAVPVLKLDQADIDDSFIDFIGTTAGDSTRSISTSTGTGSTKVGAIMIEVNGATKWIRIYDTAV